MSDSPIYLNLTVNNTSVNPQFADLYASSSYPILPDCSDYYGSIVRLDVNQFMIPISLVEVLHPSIDINKLCYSLTIQYGANISSQTYLIWSPEIKSAVIPSLGSTQTKSDYYYMYSYQTFINMMNIALKTAHQELAQTVTELQANDYPYFMFNSSNQMISLYVPMQYDSNNANHASIYVNSKLKPFLQGFNFNVYGYGLANGLDHKLLTQTLPNSDFPKNVVKSGTGSNVDYIVTYQEAVCLSNWNSLRNIYVKTSLPIQSESYLTSSNDLGYNSILTDYLPDLTGDEALKGQKTFIYNAPSLWRMFGFSANNNSIRDLSLSVYWSDFSGNTHKLLIYPNHRIDIKLMFVKKSKFQY